MTDPFATCIHFNLKYSGFAAMTMGMSLPASISTCQLSCIDVASILPTGSGRVRTRHHRRRQSHRRNSRCH